MKKNDRELEKYKDIIHLPHHVSDRRTQMPIKDRAAQFAPFSAVVGHDDSVKEAARVTDRRRELDEMEKAVIDEKLREIDEGFYDGGQVEIVYFKPDEAKDGGSYVTLIGKVKKIDGYEGLLVMDDGVKILINDIYHIEA